MAGGGLMGAAARSVVIALATLAILVRIVVPQGFMPSGDRGTPSLVICTGHGPLVIAPQVGKPAKTPQPERPCAFAGHGAATATPTPHIVGGAPISFAALVVQPVGDMAPGRGLAAPPPPSHGPPSYMI